MSIAEAWFSLLCACSNPFGRHACHVMAERAESVFGAPPTPEQRTLIKIVQTNNPWGSR